MPELTILIGKIAGIIALLGFVPYTLSILKGETQPNRVTWWIWTIIGFLLCVSYYSSSSDGPIWVPVSYVAGPLVTALLSIKYGYGKLESFDKYCLGIAVFSVLIWFLTGSAFYTLLINIFIDLLGAIPTIRKTYHIPESESKTSWLMFLVANLMNIVAITNWTLMDTVYPIYLSAISVIMVLLIFRAKKERLSQQKAR
ncbi:hypothetical protein [Vibrio quintilis]|uniref:PQ loop repeat protein n=1 Tax=Vibrio quintilis TaxID=1117707 RepID=A0A1M7YVJ3_9VIBR|nr:hypothetical protein [Vibrio quintilis]SHO56679.1 hypothetical protein VQ7734_02448 [Vibrio quintilis]